jgi:hypothetical protein
MVWSAYIFVFVRVSQWLKGFIQLFFPPVAQKDFVVLVRSVQQNGAEIGKYASTKLVRHSRVFL